MLPPRTILRFKHKRIKRKTCVRACSTAFSLSQPYACERECGLPKRCVIYGNIASNTRGSVGLVACTSKYIGRFSGEDRLSGQILKPRTNKTTHRVPYD